MLQHICRHIHVCVLVLGDDCVRHTDFSFLFAILYHIGTTKMQKTGRVFVYVLLSCCCVSLYFVLSVSGLSFFFLSGRYAVCMF